MSERMTPEEKAAKREAVIEGMVAKGYTSGVELTKAERADLLRAWPWPREAATTTEGFENVVAAVAHIKARARAEGAREALEGAARDWQCGEGFTLMARPSQPPAVPAIDYAQRTLDWLRARAASAADLGEEGRS